MSATGRGADRVASDYYPTPAWCVRRLLERLPLPSGDVEWIEPAAGDGAIIRAVKAAGRGGIWTAWDIRPEVLPALKEECFQAFTADWLLTEHHDRAGVLITNPPYSLAEEFVRHSLPAAHWVVMLLRLNFLGSAKPRVSPGAGQTRPSMRGLSGRQSAGGGRGVSRF